MVDNSHTLPSRIIFLVAVVLSITFFIRYQATPHARFVDDEGSFYSMAVQIADLEGPLPVFGPSVTGGNARMPGPLFYFVSSAPFFFSHHPLAGSIWFALLHTVSALFFFLFLRMLFTTPVALAGLILFAVAPWDIVYSDRIWASNLAPVWGMILLYAAVRAKSSGFWQGAGLFFAVTLPQIHLSAPVIWGAALAIIIVRGGFPVRKGLFIGLGAGLITYVPTLLYELETNFSNTRLLFSEHGEMLTRQQMMLLPLRVIITFLLFPTAEIGYHSTGDYWGGFNEVIYYISSPSTWLSFLFSKNRIFGTGVILTIVFSLVAWVWFIFKCRHSKSEKNNCSSNHAVFYAAVTGLLICAVSLLIRKKNFFPHYLNILFPLSLVPPALLFERIWNKKTAGKIAAGVIGIICVTTMLSVVYRYYRGAEAFNSLTSVVALTEKLSREPSPFLLRFNGTDNTLQFNAVAKHYLDKELAISEYAGRGFKVYNDRFTISPSFTGANVYSGIKISPFSFETRIIPEGGGIPTIVFGGPGGTPGQYMCPVQPALGLRTGTRNEFAGFAALECADTSRSASLGRGTETEVVYLCPTGTRMIGIFGSYEVFVRAVGVLCKKDNSILRIPENSPSTQGILFSYMCDPGLLVTGITGAGGDLVDRIGVICGPEK